MQQIRDAWPDWIVGFVRMKPAWDRFAGHTTESHLGTECHLQRLTLSDPGQATLVITEWSSLNPWIDYDVRFWLNSNKVFKPEDQYSGWYLTKETSQLCIAIIHTFVADIFLRQININHTNISAQYNLLDKPAERDHLQTMYSLSNGSKYYIKSSKQQLFTSKWDWTGLEIFPIELLYFYTRPLLDVQMYGIVECKLPPKPHVGLVSLAEVKLISLIRPVTRIH